MRNKLRLKPVLLLLAMLTASSACAQVFSSQAIPDSIVKKIAGISYPKDCQLPLDSLRYLTITYLNYQGQTSKGEMICHRSIAADLLSIFSELYYSGYPINRIALIDEYQGSDSASMVHNNTSCFNYRPAVGSSKLSKHAYGLAVDVNPLENPYVKGNHFEPANAAPYIDRSMDFPHKISKDDLCYKLFTQHGFTWGGSWKSLKDYQHFEK